MTAQLVPNDPVVDFMKNYAAKTVRLRKNILNLGGNFNAFSSVSNYFNYYLCVYCYNDSLISNTLTQPAIAGMISGMIMGDLKLV